MSVGLIFFFEVASSTYLCATDMLWFERYIPLRREGHCRSISLFILDEADSNYFPIVVLQKEADALKSTCVSRPPTRTRNATRKFLAFVTVRHTPSEL